MINQILRDEMYSDLIQDYDTSKMSEQQLSETHDKIIIIIDEFFNWL